MSPILTVKDELSNAYNVQAEPLESWAIYLFAIMLTSELFPAPLCPQMMILPFESKVMLSIIQIITIFADRGVESGSLR